MSFSAQQDQELERRLQENRRPTRVLSTKLPPEAPNEGRWVYVYDEKKMAYSDGSSWVRVP